MGLSEKGRDGRALSALSVVCALFMILQALCCFWTMGLLGTALDGGSGSENGPPEALSAQGLALLETFMSQEERRQTEACYLFIAPQSSEGQRYGKRYPLARNAAIRVLREDVSAEDREDAAKACDLAARAFLLYMQGDFAAEELRAAARNPVESGEPKADSFGSNVQLPGEEASCPEGVLGDMPEDALFALPETDTKTSEASGGDDEPQETQEEAKLTVELTAELAAAVESFRQGDGVSDMDLEESYRLLPLLNRASGEGMQQAINQAREENGELAASTGAELRQLFYKELGADPEALRAERRRIAGWELAGTFLLAVAVGILTILLSARAGRARKVAAVRLLALGCGALTGAVSGLILTIRNGPSPLWTLTAAAAAALVTGLILIKRKSWAMKLKARRANGLVLGALPAALPGITLPLLLLLALAGWIAGDGRLLAFCGQGILLTASCGLGAFLFPVGLGMGFRKE